jgi:pimeloyl-ACP methyl ester carboxylesterase
VTATAGRLTTYAHDGLVFDVTDDGPVDGEVVVLLHGFPQDATSWRSITPALNAAGYRTLAPDQRGYSPGARPTGVANYRTRPLVDDVVALLDAAGVQQAHLVGHDWGGGVAWAVGADQPQRLRTLTVLSTPHPRAMVAAALKGQALRSWYFLLFQPPGLAERVLAPGSRGWRTLLTGLPADTVQRYSTRMSQPGAFTAALAWYRALPGDQRHPSVKVGRITVPTLYVWGTRDPALGRAAATATADSVTAPYRFEALVDAGHWLPDLHGEDVAAMLLEHLAASD